ncbi:ABC transporter substrate-binding protein [Brachybacterium sp. p3-SID957]|uniref:ABC transporter substrate-binding protein n=1 Tax=Brachybacterium sp. p3-SID957 TaxID=2916049 RepID=UPI00223B24C8|nr:ABC transporter substrate-binding protein [Brachybacterium sp. p3-SID957]MCT1775389.1 ABC transporter substrate-binding protein [Brachybacterium sp. p3-SID957]
MAISRRALMGTLGASVLGAGALSGCGEGGVRRGGRGRRPTTTAPTAKPLEEPEQALMLGSIGATHGRTAPFEKAIATAIAEAMIDVNARYDGLFGQKVQMVPRHVMADPGEDITEAVNALADEGVTAVISSLDEAALQAALPVFVERGIAVIDVITSGTSVREEVDSAGMLVRLSPNDRVTAGSLAEQALSGGTSDRAGKRGTVVYLSEDTEQGKSLEAALTEVLQPANGGIVHTHFYAPGDMGDIAPIVEAVVSNHPALLVINGGPEAGPFLSALYTATLDEGNRPTLEIPAWLSPAATVDYSSAELAPEAMTRATGWEPGGAVTTDHELMMINVDPGFLTTGYAYSQQGYDAVVLACLAAQSALSVAGSDIAASVPKVLVGDAECTDFGLCRNHLRNAVANNQRATISYQGRMGAVEIGSRGDAGKGTLRTYSWNEAGALTAPGTSTFEEASG